MPSTQFLLLMIQRLIRNHVHHTRPYKMNYIYIHKVLRLLNTLRAH